MTTPSWLRWRIRDASPRPKQWPTPRRNEVTRFVGRELLYWGSDYLSYSRLTLSGGVLLLCSDGLYDMVPSNRIEEVLSCTGLSLEERCRLLLADALRAGGKDNITILLLDLD